MAVLGDSLMAIGIVLLAATLFLGYGIYSNPSTPASMPVGNATTVNGALNSIIGNMTLALSSETAVFIRIILLFLFASVGYKFVSLGISANRTEKPQGKQ